MSVEYTFRAGNSDPKIVLREIGEVMTVVHPEDILYALNKQKSRILLRTQNGLDLNESAFAAYSEKGPYYYYPRTSASNRTRAIKRTAKLLGGEATRSGVKFASYAAFKRALGRMNVDLTGPSAPHMLQAIVVRSDGVNEGIIGIYGEEAKRATGHNEGIPERHLPKREFFGFSESDEELIVKDIEEMQGIRIQKLLG